jgi:hypothetical protein
MIHNAYVVLKVGNTLNIILTLFWVLKIFTGVINTLKVFRDINKVHLSIGK